MSNETATSNQTAAPVVQGVVMPVPPNYQWANIFEPSLPNGWKWGLGLVEKDAESPYGEKISDIRAYVERSKNGKWGWIVYAHAHQHQGVEPSKNEAIWMAEQCIKHYQA